MGEELEGLVTYFHGFVGIVRWCGGDGAERRHLCREGLQTKKKASLSLSLSLSVSAIKPNEEINERIN